MLIDSYLAEFDFNELHTKRIEADVSSLYPFVRHLDFNGSLLTRVLFKLRGLPLDDLTLDTMLSLGLGKILIEEAPHEFVIGMLGTVKPIPVPVDIENAGHYLGYQLEDSIKIAWNFYLRPIDDSTTEVSTETRVKCLGRSVRNKFRIYWFFVRPFSGLIRREMLRMIRNQYYQVNRNGGNG